MQIVSFTWYINPFYVGNVKPKPCYLGKTRKYFKLWFANFLPSNVNRVIFHSIMGIFFTLFLFSFSIMELFQLETSLSANVGTNMQ